MSVAMASMPVGGLGAMMPASSMAAMPMAPMVSMAGPTMPTMSTMSAVSMPAVPVTIPQTVPVPSSPSPQQQNAIAAGAADATQEALHQERMEYIKQLVQEREALQNCPGTEVASRLIEQELERVQSGRKSEEKRAVEVTKEKSIKVTVKVLVPVREHPKFNFVGKLLGPKGNSLKRLQEETMTKMAILGKGSFRDKAKEQELCKNPDPKYGHLQEELHVEVTAHAPPAEAYARIAYALTEIRRYLVPDHNDEIRQEQMREMQILNGRPGMPDVNGQDQADSNGSLSPPSSLSPGPTLPVKLSTAQQLAAQAAQAAASANANNQAQSLLTHPAMRGLTRAQMGLLTTSMPATGMTTFPTLAPSMPGAMLGRFPFMPMGSAAMTPMGAAAQAVPVAAAAAAAAQRRSALDFLNPKTRDDLIMQSGPHPPSTTPFLAPPDQYTGYSLTVGMPMGYEEYPTTDMTSALTATHDFDGSLDIDKKDPLKRNMNRGQFRHEPYRRLAVNVPS